MRQIISQNPDLTCRYDAGITTFDTANVSPQAYGQYRIRRLNCYKGYSNGLSEIILGNAIKKLNLPREELVIMTKVFAIGNVSHYD